MADSNISQPKLYYLLNSHLAQKIDQTQTIVLLFPINLSEIPKNYKKITLDYFALNFGSYIKYYYSNQIWGVQIIMNTSTLNNESAWEH